MSWRPSGGSAPKAPPPSAPATPKPSSGSPPLLDPTLQGLIIAAIAIGLVGLGLMAAFGGSLGQGGTQTASQPAAPTAVAEARPTAPPVATAAPAGTAAPAAAAPTAAPAAAGGVVTAPIGPALASGSGAAAALGTDAVQLIFDQSQLTVSNGLVTLTFKNSATAVQHNFVLVNGDDTVAESVNNVAQAQVTRQTGAAGAVPPADTPGLLLATQMLNPGEEVSVTFQTPGPGTYKFLCTFPGHYIAGMQGELVVN